MKRRKKSYDNLDDWLLFSVPGKIISVILFAAGWFSFPLLATFIGG